MTVHSEFSSADGAVLDHTKNPLPQNFMFAQTIGVKCVGRNFLRVRLRTDGVSAFTADSLHFRLVLPNTNSATTVWPSVGANGQTIWPDGDQALHKPVYTVRHVNVEQGWIEFDVFIHEGGRVTAWAQSLTPNQTVGLVGPLGGGIPIAQDIILGGDETGFPAIARILEATNRPETGEVFLLSDVKEYDFTVPDGYTLNWISSEDHASGFVQRMTSAVRCADSYIWFAGEKSVAQALRSYFRDECAVNADKSYFSGYWRR